MRSIPTLEGARHIWVLAIVSILAGGCALTVDATNEGQTDKTTTAKSSSKTAGGSDSESGSDAAKDKKKKLEELDRKILAKQREIERLTLKRDSAQLAAEAGKRKEERDDTKKKLALAVAREKHRILADMSAPQRRRDAELDLQASDHRYKDALEELEQLEVMYEGSELEDRTSEIVLERGRRQLALAQARLDLQKQRNAKLEEELKLELAEKQAAVDDAEAELAELAKTARSNQVQRDISRLSAEHDLAEAQEALARLERDKAEAVTK